MAALSSALCAIGLSAAACAAWAENPNVCKVDEDIVGTNIKDGSKTIGEVEDVMIDLDNSRVAYVVVSLDGLVGNDDHYFVLPWGALSRVQGDDYLVSSISLDELRNAPSFSKDAEWPPLSSEPWPERVYVAAKKKPYWTGTTLPRVHRASEICGFDVRNSRNEDLGEVEEIVVDAADGSVQYAVLSFGGFLGVGEKLFAVPTRELRTDLVKKSFVLDADKARLEKAPGFDKKNWPDMASSEFRSEITAFYGDGTKKRVVEGEDGRKVAGGAVAVPSPPGRCMKSKDLVGKDVRNRQDENLGKIEEVVLDLEEGRIAYAVLSFGGFLGIGDKLFAIPADALAFSADGDKVILSVDKERLKSAPGFDKERWPELSDRAWLKSVYEYYEVHPYWVPSPPPADR